MNLKVTLNVYLSSSDEFVYQRRGTEGSSIGYMKKAYRNPKLGEWYLDSNGKVCLASISGSQRFWILQELNLNDLMAKAIENEASRLTGDR